jgi:hypothetical protein
VSALATSVCSRWFGRKTRTGRPGFFEAPGSVAEAAVDFSRENPEEFRRGRAEREAVCRAFGRGFFFISANDSGRDLEGTIILRARRASAILPDAGGSRN